MEGSEFKTRISALAALAEPCQEAPAARLFQDGGRSVRTFVKLSAAIQHQQFALTDGRHHTSDVALGCADTARVLVLARLYLEAHIEKLLAGLLKAPAQFALRQVAYLFSLHFIPRPPRCQAPARAPLYLRLSFSRSVWG